MVDRAALEMRSTRKGTGGSNPSLSAKPASINYAPNFRGSGHFVHDFPRATTKTPRLTPVPKIEGGCRQQSQLKFSHG